MLKKTKIFSNLKKFIINLDYFRIIIINFILLNFNCLASFKLDFSFIANIILFLLNS